MSPKRIVLCLDGTWNSSYDEQTRADGRRVLRPSNVLKLARAVVPRAKDGREQVVYYDIGVGSLAKYPGLANRLLYRADRLLGGMFGAGFEGNIEDALSFLSLNYVPGDEVFVFGFSRGAATARAITRFLQWSGGVPVKSDVYYLAHLFRSYVVNRGEPSAFAATVAEINRDGGTIGDLVPVTVNYLGVWDTVSALGSLLHMLRADSNNPRRSFHVGPSPATCVKSARHAIAVDERRLDFPPEIWASPANDKQQMEQRWFSGVHSNVGGSYGKDGLANIALGWLIEGATGLELDRKYLEAFHERVDGTQYESRTIKYRVLELVRGVPLRGVRTLLGHPQSANLDLHPSVIQRMQLPAVPFGEKETSRPYRPANVIRYLATIDDLPAYLAKLGVSGNLPADVAKQIAAIRKKRGRAAQVPPASVIPPIPPAPTP